MNINIMALLRPFRKWGGHSISIASAIIFDEFILLYAP
jgi:hypothetical protein